MRRPRGLVSICWLDADRLIFTPTTTSSPDTTSPSSSTNRANAARLSRVHTLWVILRDATQLMLSPSCRSAGECWERAVEAAETNSIAPSHDRNERIAHTYASHVRMKHILAESLAARCVIGIVISSPRAFRLIDRSGLPQVAVFLALGAALGPFGLRVLNISLDSAALHVVATLSLALVLFTDAVTLNIAEVRRRSALAFRLLGPGTMLTAALTGLAAWWLLELPVAGAAILGAALASSDPVLLRGLLRRRDIPSDARHALQLESGLNDVVLLPVVLVAMVFLNQGSSLNGAGFARLGLDLFILGPGAGILIGLLGVAALDLVRKRVGVRRDYESLYSLGVAFAAFAAANQCTERFLAAFAAGLR